MGMDPTVAKLIADLIGGFQKQVVALEKDNLLLGSFLHDGRKLRWHFQAFNPDEEGGGFFVEMRVITAEELADEMGDDAEALLQKVNLLEGISGEEPVFVWVDSRED